MVVRLMLRIVVSLDLGSGWGGFALLCLSALDGSEAGKGGGFRTKRVS